MRVISKCLEPQGLLKVIAIRTVAAGPERLVAITVQRPGSCASRIGKWERQVERAPVLEHDPGSCVESRTPRSTPYQVWTVTITSAATGAVTRASHGYLDGGGAVIVKRRLERPAANRRTADCGRPTSAFDGLLWRPWLPHPDASSAVERTIGMPRQPASRYRSTRSLDAAKLFRLLHPRLTDIENRSLGLTEGRARVDRLSARRPASVPLRSPASLRPRPTAASTGGPRRQR